jgi:hypothetical protein
MLPIQCIRCRNLNDYLKCKAFPKGIPEEILTGEHDHIKPFKGDGGIRFEPIKVLKTGDSDE